MKKIFFKYSNFFSFVVTLLVVVMVQMIVIVSFEYCLEKGIELNSLIIPLIFILLSFSIIVFLSNFISYLLGLNGILFFNSKKLIDLNLVDVETKSIIEKIELPTLQEIDSIEKGDFLEVLYSPNEKMDYFLITKIKEKYNDNFIGEILGLSICFNVELNKGFNPSKLELELAPLKEVSSNFKEKIKYKNIRIETKNILSISKKTKNL